GDLGSSKWMPDLLRSIDIDPAELLPRNNGSALEFHPAERKRFVATIEGMLNNLFGSDFALAFPGRSTLCPVHSHTQLWWTTAEESVADALDRIVPPTPE